MVLQGELYIMVHLWAPFITAEGPSIVTFYNGPPEVTLNIGPTGGTVQNGPPGGTYYTVYWFSRENL